MLRSSKVNQVGGKDLPKEKLEEIIASQLHIDWLFEVQVQVVITAHHSIM